MHRKDFLKAMLLLPFTGTALKVKALNGLASTFSKTDLMPVLFLGHGNPMNAITENEFVKGFRETSKRLPRPNAIICISAHWETRGTYITAMDKPRTIHDFRGFPRELYQVQYPAPGQPELAKETTSIIKQTKVELDHEWGLDHGCWSVVKHLYPDAGIPVLQLSLDQTKPPRWHYELARELYALRKKGVLIVGSGNIVHNLRMIDWRPNKSFDWAIEANEKIKKLVFQNNHKELINYQKLGEEMKLAVPTPEHYLPLLYAMGLKDEKENISFFNDKTELGSISMTSVKIF